MVVSPQVVDDPSVTYGLLFADLGKPLSDVFIAFGVYKPWATTMPFTPLVAIYILLFNGGGVQRTHFCGKIYGKY